MWAAVQMLLVLGAILGLCLLLWPAVNPSLLRSRWAEVRGGIRRNVSADQLQRQLPAFCDLLAGSVQAGASLRQALVHVGAYSEQPLSGDLRRLLRDAQFGHSVEDALALWAQRRPIQAMEDFVYAVRMSLQSGGSVSETLQRFADDLRERLKLQDKARALTAQGRLQAWVMAFIPIFLLVLVSLLDRSTLLFFTTSGVGYLILLLVLALEVVGVVWIRRIVRVEI
jgi:tight adherence protein B